MNFKTGKISLKHILVCSLIIISALAVASSYAYKDIRKSEIQHTETDTYGKLAVYFLDVGEGDASLIVSPDGYAMMIDAGPEDSQNKLIDELNCIGITELEYFVATHPHDDHIGGADKAIYTYKAKNVIMTDFIYTNETFESFLGTMTESSSKLITAEAGKVYSLGDNVSFRILSPIRNYYEEPNDKSIVIKLTYGDTSFMFAADAESQSEEDMLDVYDRSVLKSDVLKVAHHGANTSSKKEFLKAVSPKISIISCGKDNSYGHPSSDVLKRLDRYSGKIYRTDLFGTIAVVSDGKNITCSADR